MHGFFFFSDNYKFLPILINFLCRKFFIINKFQNFLIEKTTKKTEICFVEFEYVSIFFPRCSSKICRACFVSGGPISSPAGPKILEMDVSRSPLLICIISIVLYWKKKKKTKNKRKKTKIVIDIINTFFSFSLSFLFIIFSLLLSYVIFVHEYIYYIIRCYSCYIYVFYSTVLKFVFAYERGAPRRPSEGAPRSSRMSQISYITFVLF